jgi:hypothetical protein
MAMQLPAEDMDVFDLPAEMMEQLLAEFLLSTNPDPQVIVISDSEDEDVDLENAPRRLQHPRDPRHPNRHSKASLHYWTDATEATVRVRQQYYQCPKHLTYICPDCCIHEKEWAAFTMNHHGCSIFQRTKKEVCKDCIY